MILFPNAKINLGLDILFRRPDGYHEIVTAMVPAGWRDVLEIVPAKGTETTLTVSGRKVDCPPEKNLVMKAYRTLQKYVDIPPVDIYLRKIIPDGAGLGGGSADAAFTLSGLNSLFSLGYSSDELASVAAEIGADCPFFIYNRPMLATGTGTDLRPIDVSLHGLTLAIVKPSAGVTTAEAYSRVCPSVPAEALPEIVACPVGKWRGHLKNDFEASVFPLLPEVAAIKEKLYGMGAVYASMSGSGSAVYGLFRGDIMADRISEVIPDTYIYMGKADVSETL